jgi:hypothetical protein
MNHASGRGPATRQILLRGFALKANSRSKRHFHLIKGTCFPGSDVPHRTRSVLECGDFRRFGAENSTTESTECTEKKAENQREKMVGVGRIVAAPFQNLRQGRSAERAQTPQCLMPRDKLGTTDPQKLDGRLWVENCRSCWIDPLPPHRAAFTRIVLASGP